MIAQVQELNENEVTIDALRDGEPLTYKDLNEHIHNAHARGFKVINVHNVYGQRFIGAGIEGDCTINIHGTPGNDLGVFMEGPTINVFGSAEDQAGNTMNGGKIVIHGNAWDVTGLAARGGEIFVRGNGGYRIGIHMKAYKSKRPAVVYGGVVKEYFGEYMAGGVLMALGIEQVNGGWQNNTRQPIVQGSLGTGIHGGSIFIRGKFDPSCLGVGATIGEVTPRDRKVMDKLIKEFCGHFQVPEDLIREKEFVKVAAGSSRPFVDFYSGNCI